ncbi:hypothetical protein J1N35_008653 [Gossypium stocksii]|uniref:Uncharacterized protein n=1 Tax=Gossypium stocksii TaxID=47602 RepID=A0A9D4AGP8_9ROSI|nr:hypothetical protein J1N35_008653 [Gossypium stocksii]
MSGDKSCMTRNSSTPIEPYLDPDQLLRHNQIMDKQSPTIKKFASRKNPLFEEPQEPQGNNWE